MKRGGLILLLVIVMAGIFGCDGGKKEEEWIELQQLVLEPLVSKELLGEAGLEMVWQSEMPLKVGEELKQLYVIDDRIYGLSSFNYLAAINRDTGKVAFSRSLSEQALPVLGLSHFEDDIYSIVGNKLMEMDLGFGEDRSQKSFEFGVVCPAVRNSNYFYIGGSDRRVHTYNARNKVQVFEVAAISDSQITYVLADDEYVVFSTAVGDVLCITPDRPRQLWRPFKADGAIVEPMVSDGVRLIFASKDTNVYSIDLFSGELEWKYKAGAVLKEGPVVTARVVYQYVEERGLAAIDKITGAFKWQVADGAELLAESEGKAYVISREGKLIVMDNTEGERLYSVNLVGVSRYAANVNDSKMYIADARGRIACLQPAEE